MYIQPLVLIPAYGKRYKHKNDAMKDWEDGVDFKILAKNGPYCSIRDINLLKKDFEIVIIRWDFNLYFEV